MDEEYGYDENGRARIIIPDMIESPKKVVQLEIGEINYLITNKYASTHSGLLWNTLEEFGITKFDKVIGLVSELEVPAPNGDNYKLIGAGEVFRKNKNEIDIKGKSGDYNITINESHLIELLPCFPKEMVVKLNGKILER